MTRRLRLLSVALFALYCSAAYGVGLGDIEPQGHIRFITAVEALNGFLLITWSASFTFLAMGRLWPWENQCVQSSQYVDSTLVNDCGRKK